MNPQSISPPLAHWTQMSDLPHDMPANPPKPVQTRALVGSRPKHACARWGKALGWIAAFGAVFCLLGPLQVQAAVFVVDDTENDDSDAAIGNGDCKTLSDRCTLRAAIEEANATPEADIISFNADNSRIVLALALPSITAPLFVDGNSHPDGRVTLEAPALQDGAVTVRVASDGVRLQGMTLQFLPGPGVVFDGPGTMELQDMNINDNCGWAVIARGDLIIGRLDGQTIEDQSTRMAFNGTERRCPAGGILALGSVQASNLSLQGNGGPGILASGTLDLEKVSSQENGGAGLRSTNGRVILRATSRRNPDNIILFNQGPGVAADADCGPGCYAVDAVGVQIDDNGAWGIDAAGPVSVGNFAMGVELADSSVARNGLGQQCTRWSIVDGEPFIQEQDCVGGGVLINAAEPSRLLQTSLASNGGPAIMSRGDLQGTELIIQGNQGDAVVAPTSEVVLTGITTQLSENEGRAIVGRAVRLLGAANVTDNGSWGISAAETLEIGPSEDSGRRDLHEVSRNGLGNFCLAWSFTDQGPASAEFPCAGGGALVLGGGAQLTRAALSSNGGPAVMAQGDIEANELNIQSNEGDGLLSAEGSVALAGDETQTLAENLGHGLSAGGSIVIVSPATITNNGAWGALAGNDLRLTPPTGDTVTLTGNGLGDFCQQWSLPIGGTLPTVAEIACEGGGAHAQVGPIVARSIAVSTNGGDGVSAASAAEDPDTGVSILLENAQIQGNTGVGVATPGDLRIRSGQLCENEAGPFEVGGAIDLALEETEVCGDSDQDGIPNTAEDGSLGGDLNGDGVLDSLQPHVAALPVDSGKYITAVVDPGLQLFDVKLSEDAPVEFPDDIIRVLLTYELSVRNPSGLLTDAQITLLLPEDTKASGYWAVTDPGNLWADLTQTDGAEVSIEGDTVVINLEDNSRADLKGGAGGELRMISAPTRTLEEVQNDGDDGNNDTGDDANNGTGDDEELVPPPANDVSFGALCGCQTPAAPAPSAPLGWLSVVALLGLAWFGGRRARS